MPSETELERAMVLRAIELMDSGTDRDTAIAKVLRENHETDDARRKYLWGALKDKIRERNRRAEAKKATETVPAPVPTPQAEDVVPPAQEEQRVLVDEGTILEARLQQAERGETPDGEILPPDHNVLGPIQKEYYSRRKH